MKTLLQLMFLFSVLDCIPAGIAARLLWQNSGNADRWAKAQATVLAALAVESLTILVTVVLAPPTLNLSVTVYGFIRLAARCLRSIFVWRFSLMLVGVGQQSKPEKVKSLTAL